MAGEAKTSAFMLGSATVMIGAVGDLYDLNPDDNSVGLVKNFRVTSEPSYTDLTQGVKNQTVYSVMTGNVTRASMETYEYTAKNISYSLGLEGTGLATQTVEQDLTAPTSVDDVSVSVADESGFSVGDHVMIQGSFDDQIFVRKLTAVAAETLTFAEGLPVALPAGAKVMLSNVLSIGSKEDQPYLSAKIVGTLADGTGVVLLCPKIRITNGFSLGFTSENFDNLPYEFSFYDVVASDPFFTDFRGEQAKLFTTK